MRPTTHRRICVVLTARASFPRIRTAIEALCATEGVGTTVVLAASAIEPFFGDIREEVVALGTSALDTVVCPTQVSGSTGLTSVLTCAHTATSLAATFDRIQPDVVVTVADRSETLATAIAATYQNFRLCHVLGGEVSGNIDDRVRNSITMLADIHCVATAQAGARVRDLCDVGAIRRLPPVYVTGCPSIDLAYRALKEGGQPVAVANATGVGARIATDRPYVVLLQHPVTTQPDDAFDELTISLEAIHDTGVQAFVMWPNADWGSGAAAKAIRIWREAHPHAPFRYVRHLPAVTFYRLLRSAAALVGNSSTGPRECGALGVRVIDIGDRQAGREHDGQVVSVGHIQTDIAREVRKAVAKPGVPPIRGRYGLGDAGPTIAEVLMRETR